MNKIWHAILNWKIFARGEHLSHYVYLGATAFAGHGIPSIAAGAMVMFMALCLVVEHVTNE